MGFTPFGLARKVEPLAQHKRIDLLLDLTQGDGDILSGPNQVPQGFIGLVGNIHRQVAGTVKHRHWSHRGDHRSLFWGSVLAPRRHNRSLGSLDAKSCIRKDRPHRDMSSQFFDQLAHDFINLSQVVANFSIQPNVSVSPFIGDGDGNRLYGHPNQHTLQYGASLILLCSEVC
jgi:hypothetical protein